MTKMTIDRAVPRSFEVCQVAFEYDDQPGVFKKRPVIVIGSQEVNGEILVLSVKVTRHEARPGFSGEVVLEDWKQEGLPKPSVARCSKLARLPVRCFSPEKRYGRLSDADARSVCRALESMGVLASF